MHNALNWFEIPVTDMARACRFYGAILDTSLSVESMCDGQMAILPHAEDGVGGCLFHHAEFKPSDTGTLVYLNGGEDLGAILERVGPAGGAVALPKTEISPEIGYFAHFIDSEGNRVGLHSPR